MSIEASMVGYYAERASEYERIYQKPERQADLQKLRSFVESAFARRSFDLNFQWRTGGMSDQTSLRFTPFGFIAPRWPP